MDKKPNPYGSFLNGHNPENDSLVRLALEDFKEKSGLSAGPLERAQIRIFSGNDEELKERLGFTSLNGQSILKLARLVEIPSFGADGAISGYHFRLNPGIDGNRYLHPKGQPARPYILPEVWTVQGKPHKPLWITEGAKKSLKLVQHGSAAIGLQGVWNFREGAQGEETFLFDDLERFIWKGRTVYLGFDSDLWTNPQVRFALFELALKLMSRGAVIRFPKWTGEKGIDDYLAKQKDPGAALHIMQDEALPFDRFISLDHREELLRALKLTHTAFGDMARESLVTTIAKKLNIRAKRLFAELQKEKAYQDAGYSEEEKATAIELLKDPALIKCFLEVCHTRYLGRDKTLLLIKLASITRHFDRGISAVLSATSSTGKSYLIETVLLTCDPDSYENFTRTSAQYLLYRSEPLDHRIITYFELQGTGQTAEIIRTALSEGTLNLGTVLKDSAGTLKAEQIEKDTKGLVILSTHTGFRLDSELSTRVLVQELAHDEALAREVYRQKAQQNSEAGRSDDPFKIWRIADSLTEARRVTIPYLPTLAELFPTREERFHRDFEKVTVLIQASALWHQYQRETTPGGAIIADERDYRLVHDELGDIFIQSTLPISRPVLSFLALVEKNPSITRQEAQERLSVSDKSLRRYITQAVRGGFLDTTGKGPGQTFSVIDIPEPQTVLPAPEKIFSYVSGVQLSNSLKLIEIKKEKPDNAGLSNGVQLSNEKEQLDRSGQTGQHWKNGGCPIKSKENQDVSPNWTTGQPKDSEKNSDEEFEERAAITEYDGGLTREEAETQAMACVKGRKAT